MEDTQNVPAEQQAPVAVLIQLPQDYDALSGVAGMNDEVRALIGQALAQSEDQHKAELEEVHNEHKAIVDQMQAAVSELTERSRKAQESLEGEIVAHAAAQRELRQEKELRNDAEQKRDNAVALAEEAQAERDKAEREAEGLKRQVDELEGVVRTFKKPAAPTSGLTFTSTLKQETEDERKSRLERERLERINRNLQERHGLPPLKLPELPTKPAEPPVTEQQLEDAFQGVPGVAQVARGDAGGTGVQEAAAAVDGSADAPAAPTLEERVAALEKAVFGGKEQVA